VNLTPTRQRLAFGLIVSAVLLLGWFLYQPAMSSVFLLDDRSNLGGLEKVSDTATALQFAFSGAAGPLGRPLALATFLPQAAAWDEGAAPFLRVNVLIHLLNGLLAGLFFLQLSRARRIDRPDADWIAITAMALWLFLPLLASSSLMVIQRMTTLAATFMLCGLNAYLFARARIDVRPNIALSAMSGALLLATALAVLSKENGALLPTLVLVLEVTLLTPPACLGPRHWRVWSMVFLAVPTIVVALFLLSRIPWTDVAVLKKNMTAAQRLMTEARILWEYAGAAFFARPSAFGPFHDAHPVARSILDPLTLLAVVSWPAGAAAAMIWRRRYPLAAFAVLWFLGGHLLESTTIGLELYFEHRNYVPLIGPAYALCSFAFAVTGDYRRIARIVLPAYIAVNAAILFSVTSLWGNPLNASGYWRWHEPDSVRAAAHLAARQMTEIGAPVGIVTLQEFTSQHPEHAYLRLHELTTLCRISPDRDHHRIVDDLEARLPDTVFSYGVMTMLDALLTVVSEAPCAGVDSETGRRLAMAIQRNPRYANDPVYMDFHQRLLAQIDWNSGDRAGAYRHLNEALSTRPSNKLTSMIVSMLSVDGRYDDARRRIDDAERELPLNPLRRIATAIELQQLRRSVDALERQALAGRAAPAPQPALD